MRKFLMLAFGLAAANCFAYIIVPTGASYQYIDATAATVFGGSTVGWELPGYNDSGWFTGNAVFSNTGGIGSNPTNTVWDANYDPKLRKTFTLSSAASNVMGHVAIDNGFDMWLDGVHVAGANAEGYTYYWEYEFSLPDLAIGTHTIAFQLEDHGGATAFDFQMDTVPEPASLAVLGLGALALIRKRTRR